MYRITFMKEENGQTYVVGLQYIASEKQAQFIVNDYNKKPNRKAKLEERIIETPPKEVKPCN